MEKQLFLSIAPFVETGCGKKRSDGSFPVKDFAEYDQQAPAVDNADDSVDDVARDILAEARLWEALQARTSMRRPFVSDVRN